MESGLRRLILGAAVAGILGDLLLRASPWGVNLVLWVALLALAAVIARTRPNRRPPPDLIVLLLPALFFASCLAWRDAPVLRGWDVLAVVAALALPAVHLGLADLRLGKVGDYVAGLLRSGFQTAFGPLLLLSQDVDWKALQRESGMRRVGPVLIGLVLAVPVVLVFGGLLVSADPVFERVVRSVFDWDFETLISHLALSGFLTWVVAGYLRALDPRTAHTGIRWEPWRAPSLGLIELAIPLSALSLLFLVFVVVQLEYLFGGSTLVQTTTGLTYAEYARRGFFELVAVSGLVLPLLWAADWLLDHQREGASRSFHALASIQLLLVGLIMVSAITRMILYFQAYGLTQSRIYATAVMLWVAAALTWFAATVLRDRRERFAFGATVSGFAVLAALNLSNPDALVVRANLSRAEAGGELDVSYLNRLSADAVPSLVRALEELPLEQRCPLIAHLEDAWADGDPSGWRSWNLARRRAHRAVTDLEPGLGEGCRSPTASPDV